MELKQTIEELEEHVRRTNAELGSRLDLMTSELATLSARIYALDRWLGSRSMSGAGTPGPGGSREGVSGLSAELPQPGRAVAYLDGPTPPAPDEGSAEEFSPEESSPGETAMPLLPAWGRQAPGQAELESEGDEPERTEAEAPDGAEEVGEAGTLVPQTPEEGKRLYEIAYGDLMRENYQLALINFRAFQERYPGTRLSDNAQYWIGEVYYAQGQFTRAVEEFRMVIEEYPGQDKAPAAYYKLALCFQQLQDQATAKRYLEFLVEHFPNTREARLAKERLAQF